MIELNYRDVIGIELLVEGLKLGDKSAKDIWDAAKEKHQNESGQTGKQGKGNDSESVQHD